MANKKLIMSLKQEDCPYDLKGFLRQIDLDANKINSTSGTIQNGHLLAMFFSMNKQKSIVFQKFYDILKKSEVLHSNGDSYTYNKVYSKCYCVVNKYNSLLKKGKRNSSLCSNYLNSAFSITIRRHEQTKAVRTPSTLKDEDIDTDSPSTSNDFISKEEEIVKEEGDSDIYVRYFDLMNQKLDAESKNEKLAALMEDAMTKLHDAELHTHKLNTTLSDLREELKVKSQIINKLELKLKMKNHDTFPPSNTPQNAQNDEMVLTLKSKNKQLRNILKDKLELIRVLKHKLKKDSGVVDKKGQKPRGRRKKVPTETIVTPNIVKEKFRNDLENKINNLINEKNSTKISEMLLESFPDISISDFEVILKVLTDSNALVEQRIIHKWNVDGEDITYYGIIKENLKNQKKFYITYWEDPDHEQQSDDYEIVEYNSLIADIILKDLTFADPCSLF